MCFICETNPLGGYRPTEAHLARARRIDAKSPERAVSDFAWAVLSEQQQGHVAWPELRRAIEALQKAEDALCAHLRCDAVPAPGK